MTLLTVLIIQSNIKSLQILAVFPDFNRDRIVNIDILTAFYNSDGALLANIKYRVKI